MDSVTAIKLCELRDGAWGRVLAIDANSPLARRLTELGFIPGTRVRRLYSSPSGNPAAYQVRGAVIALRSGDSAAITVRPV